MICGTCKFKFICTFRYKRKKKEKGNKEFPCAGEVEAHNGLDLEIQHDAK